MDVHQDKEITESNLNLKKDVELEISAIFSGEELSEEFKVKAKEIFEAAILAKVEEKEAELQENFEIKLEEAKQEYNDTLVNKIDEYLDYVVAEWVEDNKVNIEKGLKAELVEDFMLGLKNLFAEHYVDIPDDKIDIIEEFAAKLDTMEEELNSVISENVTLRSEVAIYKRSIIETEVSEGLTHVQIAKLLSLAENIEFVSEENYREKLILVRKQYFGSNAAIVEKSSINSEDDEALEESYNPTMQHYVNSITRTLRK